MSLLPSIERRDAGFMLIEVLVALAIVAVSLVAIGSVMAGNVRAVRALERRVAVTQIARRVMATAIPPRAALRQGTWSGEDEFCHWSIEVSPPGELAADAPQAQWVPQIVRLRIESAGAVVADISSVRLTPRAAERSGE
ncbi:MAG: type II secretion system GspH family protein [Alphaproteobacteria bacterium]|nr:type II secretion system GspH family protein [Alphaproteobacteria bacterium]